VYGKRSVAEDGAQNIVATKCHRAGADRVIDNKVGLIDSITNHNGRKLLFGITGAG
jgi:hypothetical protein